MTAQSARLRFDPPPARATPELAWILARTFAAPDLAVPRPRDPRHAVALALDLDLLGRIASRIPASQLARELGEPGQQAALGERRSVAASTLRVLRTAHRVADAAEHAGLQVAFLKGAALHLSGHALVSARRTSDVDVLAPRDRAEDLQHALMDRGFVPRGTSRSPHHLAPLAQPHDPWVEVHLEIPGCRVPGSPGSMDFRALDLDDHLRPVAALGGRAFVPAPAMLAAHALVHGIDDHGFGADRYPLLRMPCDLADILTGVPDAPAIAAQITRIVGASVSAVEVQAALHMVDRLERGDLSILGEPTPSGTLLSHLLAGSLDPDYRNALRLRQVAFLLGSRSLSVAWDKLAHRLDAATLGTGVLRVSRAVALLARLLRAEIRVRRRRRAGP